MEAFIGRREAMLAPTHRNDPELNFEHWDMKRIRPYIDMLMAFGYNSIQLAEIRAYAGGHRAAGFSSLEALSRKINAVADYARSKGMRTSLFVWSQILFEPLRVYCPSNPKDRRIIEGEYARMAATYAPHFDHIIAYWGEPGPCMGRCGKCDYSTYQAMTALMLDDFKEYNPSMTASMNIWGLLREERAGRLADRTDDILSRGSPRLLERLVAHKEEIERLRATGPIVDQGKRLRALKRFARSPALPKEIGICLDGCTTGALTWSGPEPLNPSEVDVVSNAGRRVGVWGWYLTDYEGAAKSDFEIRRVNDYFESIPSRVGRLIDWHSVDITNHGWPPVLVNAFVAARKMQDPSKPLEDVLEEFCRDYFGAKLSSLMMESFLLLDKAPLVSRLLPKVDIVNLLGTEGYEHEARRLLERTRALAGNHATPRFPAVVGPREMRDFVVGRLERTMALSERLRQFHGG